MFEKEQIEQNALFLSECFLQFSFSKLIFLEGSTQVNVWAFVFGKFVGEM